MSDLKNKGVLITGGSRGLGRALAHSFARRGARVAIVGRDAAALDRVVKEIESTGGVAFAIPGDLGDKQAIHRITGAAAALVGPIDVLVNNASTLGPTPLPLLLDTACEDLEQVLQVNAVGPFRLTKVIAGSMALRRTGVVVTISSDAAVEAYPRWGAYGASKALFDHLGRTFGAELADSDVRFLRVDPGEMDTQMHREAFGEVDPATLGDPAVVAERILSLLEQRTDVDVKEVA